MCSREVTWQNKKIYFHDHNAYGHKTYQRSDSTRSSHSYIRMTSKWVDHVRSRGKLNALYLQLQKTHKHPTRQVVDLQGEAPIFEATWYFDHVTNGRSSDNLKNLYFYYHKTYDQ